MAEDKKDEEKTMLYFKGYLKGHNGWVTALTMGSLDEKPMLISASRDKTLIRWKLDAEPDERTEEIGKPLHSYKGHSHFIQDLCLSQDSKFAFTASWDKTVRLWNLKEGESKKLFQGHSKDVLAVALSLDNKMVLTGGRDASLKLWTVNAENKHTVENAHMKWVSCIKFGDPKKKQFFTGGWDHLVNVWDSQTLNKVVTLKKHTNYITCLALAPNGVILGSGSRDGNVILWNIDPAVLNDTANLEKNAVYKELRIVKSVNCIGFSSTHAWVAVGTESSLQIWDIKEAKMIIEVMLEPTKMDAKSHQCIQALSLCFDAASTRIYVGCSDNNVRVFELGK